MLEYLAAEVTKHFGFFWCFVAWEFLILGVWIFGYLGMVLIGGNEIRVFFLMINLVCFDLMNVV